MSQDCIQAPQQHIRECTSYGPIYEP